MQRVYIITLFLVAFQLTSFSQITQIEYFIDNDPGFGLATEVPVNDLDNANHSFELNTKDLPKGFHTIGFRTKNGENWGITNFKTFYVHDKGVNDSLINQIEYFIDQDIGYGLATNVPVESGAVVSEIINLNVDSLTEGFHTVGFRTKVSENWGITNFKTFYVQKKNNTDSLINQIEYFINEDPGIGLATNVPINISADAQAKLNINAEDLTKGFHSIGFRSKAGEKWGILNSVSFYYQNYKPDTNIVLVEYFIDSIGEFDEGEQILNSGFGNLNEIDTVKLDNYDIGSHSLFVRSKTENGQWSPVYVADFEIVQGFNVGLTVLGNNNPLPGAEVVIEGLPAQ